MIEVTGDELSLRLAFDVGGSFVKAGLVHIESGLVMGEALRRATPAGAAPEAVLELLVGMARELPSSGPVGLAFPAVAKQGVAWTAANIDKRWIGLNVQAHAARRGSATAGRVPERCGRRRRSRK